MAEQPTKVHSPDRGGPYIAEKARFGRRFFWFMLILGLLGALLVGVNAAGLLPGLRNPFVEQTTDNSQPPILKSIKDLSRFVAAEGNFEVVIDLKKDRKYVPDFLLNQRTLFVAAGTVECYVDFADLKDENIKVSADRTTVEITLPQPVLDDPKIDIDRSYVFAEDRGLINRMGDFFGSDANRQQETLIVAEQKLAEAAKASELTSRAQENTRKTLESLLHSLGYTTVIVTYSDAG